MSARRTRDRWRSWRRCRTRRTPGRRCRRAEQVLSGRHAFPAHALASSSSHSTHLPELSAHVPMPAHSESAAHPRQAPASQMGVMGSVQSVLMRQATHSLSVSQKAAGAAQCVLSVQATHVSVVVSHTGVAPVHAPPQGPASGGLVSAASVALSATPVSVGGGEGSHPQATRTAAMQIVLRTRSSPNLRGPLWPSVVKFLRIGRPTDRGEAVRR